MMGVEPVRSLDDVVKLGKHVKERGFKALKTNIFRFDLDPPSMHQPGFARGPGHPELNADRATLAAITDGLAAFRQGAGPDMGIHLDTNFNFKTEGYIKVARACEPYDLSWLEIDSYDPEGLRLIRDRAPMPIASCEVAVRPPPVPAVLREPFDRCRDHRRALERSRRVAQDRRDGGSL